MDSIIIDVREIEFLSKFWSLDGINMLMVEFFLAIVNHRLETVRNILDNETNLSPEEKSCYTNGESLLRRLVDSCKSLYPVLVNCSPNEFKDCMNEYFNEYNSCIISFSRPTFSTYVVSELETPKTLLMQVLGCPDEGHKIKVIALNLISHYIKLFQLLEKSIQTIESNGRKIDLDVDKLNFKINELYTIYTTVKGMSMDRPKDPPERRSSSPFYCIIRRFYFLTETITSNTED